jgi:DNA polymerase III gamma/tau subunit
MTRPLLTRHRPETFAELIGQADAVAAFKAAADNGSQVFLCYGPTGVGKTTLARLGAGYLKAQQLIEIDAANANSVDDMRALVEPYSYHLSATRAVILDEAHRLTAPAWTVLLKPLEEPPAGLFWFLLTTELSRVPANIRSRCVPLHLVDVGRDALVDLLTEVCRKEKWSTPRAVIALCAQHALGSPRFALTFLAATSRCKTREAAAALIDTPLSRELTPDQPGYRLAQALKTPQWPVIQTLLREIRDAKEHPEGIRQVVRAYYAAIVADSKDERAVCYAAKVLDHFAEPMSDFAALAKAVCRTVFGN